MAGTSLNLHKRKGSHIDKDGYGYGYGKKQKFMHGSKGSRMGKNQRVRESKDWFSELPEHVIHHILAYLRCPKDVARTSILSKRWKSIWDSFDTFDFDQRSFHVQGSQKFKGKFQLAAEGGQKKFIRHVDKSMSTRLPLLPSIKKFKLDVTSLNCPLAARMNFWMDTAINKHVRELEVNVQVMKRKLYVLPPIVLNSKTITSLKLCGCRLDGLAAIQIPNLREFSIKVADVNDVMIQNFVHNCSLIEDFRIVSCRGLENLRLSSLANLKRIDLYECYGLRLVEIEATKLQTLWFYRNINTPCKMNLAGCENLKNLTLKDTKMTEKFFQNMIEILPALEKLVLVDCNRLEHITILSSTLKRLSLIHCNRLEEANIDAPNLLSLEYTGSKMCFSNMKVSGLEEFKVYSKSGSQCKQFCDQMEKFLENFEHSEHYKLVLHTQEKYATIYGDLSRIKLPTSSDYKIELTKSSSTFRGMVNSMLRTTKPRHLRVASSPCSKSLLLLKDMITKRESPKCCRYYSQKCWRHYLKHVEVVETANQTNFTLEWRNRALKVSI